MKKNTSHQLTMKQEHEQSVKQLRSLFYGMESAIVRVAVARIDLDHAEADLERSTRVINDHIKVGYEDCILDAEKLIGDLSVMADQTNQQGEGGPG